MVISGVGRGASRGDHAARISYGGLLALLAAPTRDIPHADAFEQAPVSWPAFGISANPTHPEAWLPTVARNRQRDLFKSAHRKSQPQLRLR